MATATAKKSTAAKASKSAAPKVETVDPRQEAAGVKTAIKADFDNPESPLIYDPKGALAAPADPVEEVKLKPGETAAQFESHVQLSGPAIVQERLEKEAGPKGLPTEIVAREQHERAARLEHQRIDGGATVADANHVTDETNPSKTGPDAA